uniref:Extra-large guanine nucleotide-binding protein 1 n=1 Tax=Davidia involucrata TaxID=16924 RepID=A0A5B7C8P6_DAVIN
MTSFLKKLLPVAPPNRDDGDDYDVEYSFAMEYSGPPVTYDVPRVFPVDIKHIPTAAVVAPAAVLNNLSFPIVQPIAKSNPSNKKLSEESQLRSQVSHSGEFVGVIDSSDALGSTEGEEHTSKVLDGIGSSGSLGFSDSRDDSRELSGSSEVEDGKEVWDLNESGVSSRPLSSEISSEDEASCRVNRTSVVTFCDPESSDIVVPLQKTRANVKKGLCHRCHKGNRFTEKEVCIVCSAKYCANCVLRAMGSMPEGRKCITCIGFQIDESKRGTLGKSSGMLKRLLTNLEVKQIMSSEISCERNLIPPELVCVNGKLLCKEELVILQSCSNRPKKLKPGKYWYDKVSGLWGKEGHRPCQIISPQLSVGDPIKLNASNGNTNILINNREITKAELWMLQLARINCEGSPHFWVSADGSYQEEGQKNVMGKIWDKTGIKLVCAVLSLPTPSESANPCLEEVGNLSNRVVPNYLEQTLHKLLLVGHGKSGTSTIFKQAKIVYNIPFPEVERQNIKLVIQSNLYRYIGILLEGREQFEEEWLIEMRKKCVDQSGPSGNSVQIDEQNIYSISPRLKAFSDWLLQVMVSGNLEVIFPAATHEYAPLVEELWNDGAFQATYNRRNELHMLPRVANYFLNRAVEISRTDYEPSDMDILYAEGITSSNGLASMEFSFPKSTQDSFLSSSDQIDPLLRYQLIRVHASSLGENCKWLEMFEDVDLVLFCVSLTDYDDANGVPTNKMLESKKLFENIVTHPNFSQKNFLLILNKFDLLEEKIEQVPLTQCEWFHDFNPVISVNPNGSSNPSLAHRAFHYIAVKFKRLFYSLTGRNLFISLVTGLEPDSVDEAFKYAKEILKWDEEKPSTSVYDWSSGSIEASSSS